MVDESESPVPPVAKKRLVRSRRQMYLQIVAATVILACGIVIGASAVFLHVKEDIVRNPLPPRLDILGDMVDRYGLTEEQAEKVDVVLKASRERMHEHFKEIIEKRDAEFKELSAAFKVIFATEQFKQWQDDSRRRMRRGPGRFGPRRPGPGDGPGPGGRRPPDWPGGPGGGRGGYRPDPNERRTPGGPGGGRSGRGRLGREGFGARPRGPAEPNSPVE